METIGIHNTSNCYCAASAGNNLYVAGFYGGNDVFCYDTEGNLWEKRPHPCSEINNLCVLDDYMYAISSDCNEVPQRYSFAKCHWQTFAKVGISSVYDIQFYNSGSTVLNSKVYVLYGCKLLSGSSWLMQNARLHCFDPVKNEWKKKQKPVNLTLNPVCLQ